MNFTNMRRTNMRDSEEEEAEGKNIIIKTIIGGISSRCSVE